MLKAIEVTSLNTLDILKQMIKLIDEISNNIKEKMPKIYSKELIEVLFYEFYTKISFVEEGLKVSRKTASTYLIKLEQAGFLSSEIIGREIDEYDIPDEIHIYNPEIKILRRELPTTTQYIFLVNNLGGIK